MEKNYRLILKNLPLNVNDGKIEKLLKDYVTISNIDLKEKIDLDESTKKFAFVNICTTDQNLQTCFRELNNKILDGFQISVELAKESFLERLRRERNEDQLKKNYSNAKSNQAHSTNDSFNDIRIAAKTTHRTPTDSDLCLNEFKNKENKRRLKYNEEIEDRNDNSEKQEASSERSYKNLESNKANRYEKNKSIISNDSIDNDNKLSTSICENLDVNESEKKRIMSLKQKKEAFKMQKQTIHDSLRFVDNKNSTTKIVFNDNLEFQNSEEKTLPRKNALFNSDDEDEENYQWNEDLLDAKANLKQKLHKLQKHIGSDQRFALDERFIDDDDKDDETELNENKFQPNTLEQSIKATDKHDAALKQNRMVRYDPTASNHQDYEVITEKPEPDKTDKRKKKRKDTEIKTDIPVPVSNEIFYDVSQNLMESLKKNEQFSLLQTFGRAPPNNTANKNDITNEVEENTKFQFNHHTKKMKYDSSDTEDNEEIDDQNKATLTVSTKSTEFNVQNDRLFFCDNDPRFSEAKNFFKNQSAREVDTFTHTRRKLKEIVRSKIRRNLKKSTPWNRKKIRKVQKRK